MNTNNYLSITDISEILCMSRSAVDSWMVKGYIKFSIIGNLRKIRSEDLIKYLRKLGNSPVAMEGFKRDIENYLKQK